MNIRSALTPSLIALLVQGAFAADQKPKAKAVTARMEYNTANCEECSNPEWLCKCPKEDEKK